MAAVRCASLDSRSCIFVSFYAFAAGGSADSSTNAALAAALRAAKSAGVPRTNIENALRKVRYPTGDP